MTKKRKMTVLDKAENEAIERIRSGMKSMGIDDLDPHEEAAVRLGFSEGVAWLADRIKDSVKGVFDEA